MVECWSNCWSKWGGFADAVIPAGRYRWSIADGKCILLLQLCIYTLLSAAAAAAAAEMQASAKSK